MVMACDQMMSDFLTWWVLRSTWVIRRRDDLFEFMLFLTEWRSEKCVERMAAIRDRQGLATPRRQGRITLPILRSVHGDSSLRLSKS
jgi:hypothetical protein